MNREILFKGQLVDTKEWVYGTYHYSNDSKHHYILNREKMLLRDYHNDSEMALHEKEVHLVIPETVSQFTGMVDRNNKQIFENDIAVYDNHNALCSFIKGSFVFVSEFDYAYGYEVEIIGNKFDNAEMLDS